MSTLRKLELEAHMATGEVLTCTAYNPDFIRWELTAAKERWPTVEVHGGEAQTKAPMLMNTFLAFAALSRTGDYSGKWDEFSKHDCLQVDVADELTVDPTQPGADPG